MKIASRVIDLTPTGQLPMGGHDGPDRLTRRRHGTLEANIVVWRCATGTIAIVSLDTLFAGPDLTDAILASFRKWHGLSEDQVLILASHTHFAPMLDRTKPRLGKIAEQELVRWQGKLDEAIGTLSNHLVTRVRIASGESDKSTNRRLRWLLPTAVRLLGKTRSNIYLCDNPNGDRDPTIRIFLYQDVTLNVRAILWSFSCHPVGFPQPDTASADYVGVVREKLRQVYGRSVPVVFAPGCMGDVRPRSPKSWKQLRNILKIMLYGPCAPEFSVATWGRWANELADEVLSIAKSARTESLDNAVCTAVSNALPMEAIFTGTVPVNELRGKAVSIPGIGRLITLSCEPVTAVAEIIRRDKSDLVLGYEGNVFGYLPTDRLIDEGGYEADRFMDTFGLEGTWKSSLDQAVMAFGRSLTHDGD